MVQIVPTYSITSVATSPRDVRSAVKQNTSFHKIKKTWKHLYSTGAALHLKLSTNGPDKPDNLAEHPETKDTDQERTSIDVENHRQNLEEEITNLGERRQKSRQGTPLPYLPAIQLITEAMMENTEQSRYSRTSPANIQAIGS